MANSSPMLLATLGRYLPVALGRDRPRVCKNTFTSCMPQPTAPGRSDFPSFCHDQRRWRVRALIKHCGTSWDSKNRGFYAVIAFNKPSVPMIFITRFRL